MGLFDRFKRRVQEVADDVDSEELTATEDSDEGQVALQTATEIEEDWEEEPLSEPAELPAEPTDSDDEWDDWDEEEEEIELPRQLSKKERKRMENWKSNASRNYVAERRQTLPSHKDLVSIYR